MGRTSITGASFRWPTMHLARAYRPSRSFCGARRSAPATTSETVSIRVARAEGSSRRVPFDKSHTAILNSAVRFDRPSVALERSDGHLRRTTAATDGIATDRGTADASDRLHRKPIDTIIREYLLSIYIFCQHLRILDVVLGIYPPKWPKR